MQLYSSKQYIWSSATLYTRATVNKREHWLADFIKAAPNPTQENILHFHQFTGNGDSKNDLQMRRDGEMGTVSVTGIVVEKNKDVMKHLNLKNGESYQLLLNFATAMQEA